MPTPPIQPFHYLEDAETIIWRVTDPEYDDDPPTVEKVAAAALTLQQELKRTQRELEWARAAVQQQYGKPTTPGGGLLLSTDAGGLRYYLNGMALHAGDGVFLLTEAGWLPGRFEYARTKEDSLEGFFHFYIPGAPSTYSGQVAIPLTTGARLAWPDDIKGRR
jgi:hypothetical protein